MVSGSYRASAKCLVTLGCQVRCMAFLFLEGSNVCDRFVAGIFSIATGTCAKESYFLALNLNLSQKGKIPLDNYKPFIIYKYDGFLITLQIKFLCMF